ncbi:MAG: phosphoserine phosphatase SerB [Candidatus Latescibacterota bacterium]|nr:MAG: phosphoserine phosphatase SerB [Candidatus Latescibacterota bacterium]
MSSDYLAITLSGRDRPGIAAAFAAILQQARARIVDVEQATLQDILALSFLVDLAPGRVSQRDVLDDLLRQAKEMGLELNSRAFSPQEMVTRKARFLYVITCISERPVTDVLAEIAPVMAQRNVNIATIRCLAEKPFSCLEMIADGTHARPQSGFRAEMLSAAAAHGIDVGIQRESIYRRNKRLIVLDMDSTLISQEIINELARVRGVGQEIAHLTERAMRGEIGFPEALRQRVERLQGLTLDEMKQVAESMSLNEGVERVLRVVKRLGYRVALVSSGFDFFTEYMKRQAGLDYAYGNVLEMRDGRATGRVTGELIDAAAKARILLQIAERERVHPEQVVAIGDGANDILMLSQAGLGIAFNARPVVKRSADAAISGGMHSILYLLGITERDLAEIDAV